MIARLGCPQSGCSHSISRRLSRKLALFTMLVLGALFTATWFMVKMVIVERTTEDLATRSQLLTLLVTNELRSGGETALRARLQADAAMRPTSRIELKRADGSLLYADPEVPGQALSADYCEVLDFTIAAPQAPGGTIHARYTVDYAQDAAMGRRWIWILSFITLAAGALVAAGSYWHVRRALQPLRELAGQTRAISPRELNRRLTLADPAEELLPWIEQFNALMERLERAVAQLEAFNADVAHELRTPLAALIGETEVALSRERSPEVLRTTLESNLEEMQRLAALVNDMLFLASADRGAVARRGEPQSLAALAREVAEFHEAAFDEAGLALRIDGDATLAVDAPLFKRAVSNLLGNAARYAERGSTVHLAIAPDAPDHVRVEVRNAGAPIDADHLPRLFDRFFRADASRCCPETGETHHGLGLAIVAAIARMHAGRTLADSTGGTTRVGFTLALH
jgi:two-component system heavy metal sensor histidine kinase CusS